MSNLIRSSIDLNYKEEDVQLLIEYFKLVDYDRSIKHYARCFRSLAKLSKNRLDNDFLVYGLTRFVELTKVSEEHGIKTYPKDF